LEEYEEPGTAAEVLVAEAWKEVLGIDRVGVDDNYFSNLGGDSLSVLRVIEIIRKQTGVRLDPNMILLNTLRQIAAVLPLKHEKKVHPVQVARQVKKDTRTQPSFFGNPEKRLFGIYHPPRDRVAKDIGVLLCYPIAQEYVTTHWAFHNLGTVLSKAGYHALRFDYYGTGDSAGAGEEGTLSQWRADIRAAFKQLKEKPGVRRVSAIGLRLGGALLAQECTNDVDVKDLVLWDPIVSGKTQLEELEAIRKELRSHYMPWRRSELFMDQYDELLGYPVSSDLQFALRSISLLGKGFLPEAERVWIVVSEEKPEYLELCDRLRQSGADVQYCATGEMTEWGKISSIYDVQRLSKGLSTITNIFSGRQR
jgi:acyl carrier protein